MNSSELPLHPPERKRPLALYVRGKHNVAAGATFVEVQEDEYVEALRLHADVVTKDNDFDFDQVCDQVQPDFVIIEPPGGLRTQPIRVENRHSHPDIPRIAFYKQDPHDTSRPIFLKTLDEWGLDHFLSMAPAQSMHSPELAGRAFIIPIFIDDMVFRDYGEDKIIPVSIFGGRIAPGFYPWRAETTNTIHDVFPTLIYTHPGYQGATLPFRFPIWGVDYAKMLSRCRFSLADTTRTNMAVRKHLEIPACGSVLVAPESQALADYGFRDMENAILGSGMALYQKIAHVASDPDLYEKIRKAGHGLVHGRYTRRHWTGVLNWYDCARTRRPGERVVQQGRFGPFVTMPDEPELPACVTDDIPSEYTVKLQVMTQAIRDDDLQKAVAIGQEVNDWLRHMAPESLLLLGIVSLLGRDVPGARALFQEALTRRVEREGHGPYDPCEIAWLILTGVLMGDAQLVVSMMAEAEGVKHLMLRRMRWLVDGMFVFTETNGNRGVGSVWPGLFNRQNDDRLSIHWLGQEPFGDWLSLMQRILKANHMPAEQILESCP